MLILQLAEFEKKQGLLYLRHAQRSQYVMHGVCRFIGGLKAALNTPASMLRSPKKPLPTQQQSRGLSEIEVSPAYCSEP
jgi:hypothetical protein